MFIYLFLEIELTTINIINIFIHIFADEQMLIQLNINSIINYSS